MDSETPDMFLRQVDGVTLVRLKATHLTSINDVTRLNHAFEAMIAAGARKLIIDFKLVEHVGSATLGMMIGLQKQMKELKGRLIISHAENLDEVLKVSRTGHLFTLAPDSRSAMAMLTGKAK